jgi:hypothetical protein
MTNNRIWHVMEAPAGASSKTERLKVFFEWPGRSREEFTQSQLRATIQILRQQGKPTAEYEEGLAGLVELEGVT